MDSNWSGFARSLRGEILPPYLSTLFLWWQAVAGIIASNRATRCAVIRGARGDTARAHETYTTLSSAARSARCTHAGASLQTSTADPRGIAPLRHPLASRDTPVAHTGGATTQSPHHSTGCAARPSRLFSPPGNSFFILDARWKLLI